MRGFGVRGVVPEKVDPRGSGVQLVVSFEEEFWRAASGTGDERHASFQNFNLCVAEQVSAQVYD